MGWIFNDKIPTSVVKRTSKVSSGAFDRKISKERISGDGAGELIGELITSTSEGPAAFPGIQGTKAVYLYEIIHSGKLPGLKNVALTCWSPDRLCWMPVSQSV